MKLNILIAISIVVVTGLLLTGCEDEKVVTQTDIKTEDIHISAVNDAKKAIELLNKQTAQKDQAVEKAIAKTVEVAPVADKGALVFAKCITCHGKDGKKSAFNKSAIIAGQSVEEIIISLNGYKAGTRDVSGMGKLMGGQVSSLSDADIQSVAEYISGL